MTKKKPYFIREPYGLPRELQPTGKFIRKTEKIDGMPLKAVRKMLENPRTPERLKEAWREKLKKAKLKEVA